uniref:Uncharacterized protein n=1 Tax=Rhizophora mucronata TaxID=61149 RepID=A0A2P2LRK1_RHIMU
MLVRGSHQFVRMNLVFWDLIDVRISIVNFGLSCIKVTRFFDRLGKRALAFNLSCLY